MGISRRNIVSAGVLSRIEAMYAEVAASPDARAGTAVVFGAGVQAAKKRTGARALMNEWPVFMVSSRMDNWSRG